MERYNKTGRYIDDDPEFPNTFEPGRKAAESERLRKQIKTAVIAGTISAVTMCSTAQAQDPIQYEDYSAANLIRRFFGWFEPIVQNAFVGSAKTPSDFAYSSAAALQEVQHNSKMQGLRSGQGGQPGKFGPKND